VTDWAALEGAAAALRRLNRLVGGYEVPADVLAEVRAAAEALVERIGEVPMRDKRADMEAMMPDLRGGIAPVDTPIGEPFAFDAMSVAGGRMSPSAPEFAVRRAGPNSAVATVVADAMFQGPPERIHGGVVAMLFDEIMGATNRVSGNRGFTARLVVNYRAGAPIRRPVEFQAWVESVEGRKIHVRAEARDGEVVFADAEALFGTPRDGVF
jgi:acyl-coenzyme A thioesterase PaaI-like protein